MSETPAAASRLTKPMTLLAVACAWPFVNFVGTNLSLLTAVDMAVIAAAFLIVFTPSALWSLAFGALRMPAARDFFAAGLAAFTLVFLNYPSVVKLLHAALGPITQRLSVNYFYLALAVAAFLIGGRLARVHGARVIFGTFLYVAFAASLAGMVMEAYDEMKSDRRTPPAAVGAEQKESGVAGSGYIDGFWHGESQPIAAAVTVPPFNIYYLILDEYARADQLKAVTGFDNSPTISALRAKGFQVDDKAYANYPVTFLSLGTSLGMAYPVGEGAQVKMATFMPALQGSNAATQAFKSLGYKYLHLPSQQWGGAQCGADVDLCLIRSENAVVRKLETTWETINLLARMTPISYFMRVNLFGTTYAPRLVDDVVEYWDRASKLQPFFLFGHTLPPHAPFFFKPDCSRQDRVSFDLQSSGANERQLYIDNLQCANRYLLKLIDFLDANDPNALVVIQSDHGSKFSVEFTWKTQAEYEQRYGILMAVRAPERCRQWLYPGLSPVNIMRFALGCATGREPSYLKDRHFLLYFDKNPKYMNIGRDMAR
jgi:hypothetical protein